MKAARSMLFAAMGLASVAGAPAVEREARKDAYVAFMTLDYQAEFVASFPGRDAAGVGGLLLNDKDQKAMHRILVDKDRGLFYGYDVTITKAGDAFDVAIGPLGPEAARYFVETRWALVCPGCPAPRQVAAAQRFPAPRSVRAGDTVSVDLLEDAHGAVVGDQITVKAGLVPTQPKEEPVRVFAPVDLEAKAVWLQMAEPQLLADGARAWPEGTDGGSVQGEVIWVDLPGHGRATVSLDNHAQCGWRKIGVVSGNTITFTIDGIKYEWVSKGPIATPGPVFPFRNLQSWHLWINHDKDYRPYQDRYSMGAGGSNTGCPNPLQIN